MSKITNKECAVNSLTNLCSTIHKVNSLFNANIKTKPAYKALDLVISGKKCSKKQFENILQYIESVKDKTCELMEKDESKCDLINFGDMFLHHDFYIYILGIKDKQYKRLNISKIEVIDAVLTDSLEDLDSKEITVKRCSKDIRNLCKRMLKVIV